MDVDDLDQQHQDGLHMASLGGSWLAVVAGFGGMRDHGGELRFRPRIPERWVTLCSTCGGGGATSASRSTPTDATYTARAAARRLAHYGEATSRRQWTHR